ncbi:MAG TPA: xanthine dehydrogenase family protein molybdopterin-binding subunit [Xanthobacteraceae bacterium]|nr:xanthine dehydrogenase family protein molybdopterin-binding subunit [Xanthobacteraceae bacterium]
MDTKTPRHASDLALDNAIALQKYAVGQPVLRKEDDNLVRGKGRYTDDFNLPGQAHAWIVRSSHPHGVIRAIDIKAARAMPGVLGIWTGKDLQAAGYAPIRCSLPMKNADGSPLLQTDRMALAIDKVRFVGDPVACVVAETAAQARDAAEAVVVEIDELPSVTKSEDAIKPGAPQLYDHIPNNIALDYHFGDQAATEAAFAKAAHVTSLDIVNTRVAVVPMEPRAGLASYDETSDRFTVYLPTQGVSGNVTSLAKLMNLPREKIRLLTYNVGGSFGMKNASYPEYVCLLHASRLLRRPVKWLEERSSSFLSDSHGRAQEVRGELALDAKGNILALRISGFGNLGSYVAGVGPLPLSLNIGKNIASVYRTPLIEVDIKCVVTNTTFMGAYRGAGRPEANYFMERLMDRAAAEMGIDRLTLRRRNMIKPAQLPFNAASGMSYDSGNFPAVLDKALDLADYVGFAKRKREARRRGKLRGIAIGCYLEVTAGMTELGKINFEPDGTVRLTTGTLDFGQGHATPFAQVLASRLGIPFESIRLEQNDSDVVHSGGGTGGSRSIMTSGTAIVEASDLVIAKGKTAAANRLEASEDDIEFSGGRFTIAGTDRSIGLIELAEALRTRPPQDGQPSSLDVDHTSSSVASTFPNGCHVSEVEIDPDTGVTRIVKYTAVNDFGVVINPMIVAGQLHGGIVQGIGQALMEAVSYDESGQPITGSLMDYALPRAADVPSMTLSDMPSPATTNPLGAKGCGEAGCAGSLATLVNAVIDAMADEGVTQIEMPLTPERVWRALRDARQAARA